MIFVGKFVKFSFWAGCSDWEVGYRLRPDIWTGYPANLISNPYDRGLAEGRQCGNGGCLPDNWPGYPNNLLSNPSLMIPDNWTAYPAIIIIWQILKDCSFWPYPRVSRLQFPAITPRIN